MKSLFLYINTLKHLKFSQVIYRIWYRYSKVRVDSFERQIELITPEWFWAGCNYQKQSLLDSKTVIYLSKEADISSIQCWNDASKDKLWLYNLHYFDDLNAEGFENRASWHKSLIDRWINENSPCDGNGWEPYPLSLRIVNWCKWFSKVPVANLRWNQSLFQQAQALLQQVEFHILGNHLFANAKALIFAGVYLERKDDLGFLVKGLDILKKEIPEQFLKDGGHFELSPMYHQIMLWDLLDLIELARLSRHPLLVDCAKKWEDVVEKCVYWLGAMLHPDKKISFFNDAAFEIGPDVSDINRYLGQLNFKPCLPSDHSVIQLPNSGFISASKFGDAKLIVDIGDIGPKYQPGHGHADTLSFELSIWNNRLFVNSGTSMYGIGKERDRQRSTSAHNTLNVNNASSSEVWGGFRVANRAKTLSPLINENSEYVSISASHDGYKKKFNDLIHKRTWNLSKGKLEVVDEVICGKGHNAKVHFHLHPDVKVTILSKYRASFILNEKTIIFSVFGAEINLCDGSWHPEFGKSIPSKLLVLIMRESEIKTEILWGDYE